MEAADTWWITNINTETDARSNITLPLGSGRLRTIQPYTVHVPANINDVKDLMLSQDNNPLYKLVLSLKEDSMNRNFDLLLLLTVMQLFFLLLTIT